MAKKNITGYVEPLSVRAGQAVKLFAASHSPGNARLDLVRKVCGDPTRNGPGFKENVVESHLPDTVSLLEQPISPGSYAEIDLASLALNKRLAIALFIYPTAPSNPQTILALASGSEEICAITLVNQRLVFLVDGNEFTFSDESLIAKRWYRVGVSLLVGSGGRLETSIAAMPSRSPGRDFTIDTQPVRHVQEINLPGWKSVTRCLLAASLTGKHYDGRIARPKLEIDDVAMQWDFSREISTRDIVDIGRHACHGRLHQLPARAVTGPDWDGSVHSWQVNPAHYDAIHFHRDDLYDANWSLSAELKLPSELPSGIYAFRLDDGTEIDRIPFFVRPAVTSKPSKIALLMSSCTYMAYANHRMLFEGADFVSARAKLRPEHEYVRDHPELGPSMYEKHSDGSGVMYSSRRRPVMQLRPGADGWNFTPDTNINAFMEHLKLGHDVIADEDIHSDGFSALEPYRVIVTGSHPEYWSTAMIEALDKWQRNGGRLVYLGGNGFYWRVAFSDAWPGAIELRRAEDGVRNWQTEAGESYHSFNGEYGGLWRRLGRPPNELVGVGFAAQGFERAIPYRRTAASCDSRAAWIFAGVDDELIGTSGLGGGAAGQEVDRYNEALGSPKHALILASATDFGSDMTRTKEELDAAIIVPSPDPVVRADVVFFETPNGGAVFSVGSISWFGALARNEYDNDIAKITENVLRRFLDPEVFEYTEN